MWYNIFIKDNTSKKRLIKRFLSFQSIKNILLYFSYFFSLRFGLILLISVINFHWIEVACFYIGYNRAHKRPTRKNCSTAKRNLRIIRRRCCIVKTYCVFSYFFPLNCHFLPHSHKCVYRNTLPLCNFIILRKFRVCKGLNWKSFELFRARTMFVRLFRINYFDGNFCAQRLILHF